MQHRASKCMTYETVKKNKDKLFQLIRCIKVGPFENDCFMELTCYYCNGNHLMALCPNRGKEMKIHAKFSKSNCVENTNFSNNKKCETVLLKCLECKMYSPNKKSKFEDLLIMLNDGNTSSYISNKAAKKLDLLVENKENLSLRVFNESITKTVKLGRVFFGLSVKKGNNLIIQAHTLKFLTRQKLIINMISKLVQWGTHHQILFF